MALAAASASMGAANCSTPNMPWQGAMAGKKVFVYTAQNKDSFEVHACLFYSWHVKCTMDNEVLLLLCCCSAAAALLLCCCCPAAAALLLLPCCCCCSAAALLPAIPSMHCSATAALLLLLCCCCPAAAALLLLLCCCCPAALLLLLCQNMPINFDGFL